MTCFIRCFARLLVVLLMILGLGIAAIGSLALTAAIKLGQRYWPTADLFKATEFDSPHG